MTENCMLRFSRNFLIERKNIKPSPDGSGSSRHGNASFCGGGAATEGSSRSDIKNGVTESRLQRTAGLKPEKTEISCYFISDFTSSKLSPP